LFGAGGETEWRAAPAYNALEEEFTLAAAMIEARASAGLTQQGTL